MSRFKYELARDHDIDADSTTDLPWHIVRIDDEADPPHLHTLCDRMLKDPVERWREYSVERMVDLICHQCLSAYVAEAGSEAA